MVTSAGIILNAVASRKTFVPNLPLTIAMVSWGFNFVALKLLYRQMTAPAVSLVRFGLMYILLVLVCWVKKESLRILPGDVFKVLFAGFLAMGIYMILFLQGMVTAGAAEGAIILAAAPIFTGVFAVLARQEKFSPKSTGGAVLAFLGVALVVLANPSRSQSALVGKLLVAASSVLWAYSAVYMRPLLRRYSAISLLTLSMPGALVALIPYGWRELGRIDWAAMTTVSWLMLAQLAILSGVIGFICFYLGIKQIGAAQAMLYQYFVPPGAAFFAWLILHQSLHPMQALGLVVVIAGIVIASRYRILIPAANGPQQDEPRLITSR